MGETTGRAVDNVDVTWRPVPTVAAAGIVAAGVLAFFLPNPVSLHFSDAGASDGTMDVPPAGVVVAVAVLGLLAILWARLAERLPGPSVAWVLVGLQWLTIVVAAAQL